jgi:preprotein translocase subunit SecB
MADETGGAADTGRQTGPTTQPQFTIRAQYVKDLSFENPRAPDSLQQAESPKVELSVAVNGHRHGEEDHEVELQITARARHGEEVAFIAELTYAGLFHLSGFTPEQVRPVVLIECPRHLFPFARRVLADCTRDGGFPPLMLDPIDFVTLYRRSREQTDEGGTNGADASGDQEAD